MAENKIFSGSQSQVFLEGEGDNWFRRNKSSLDSKEVFHEAETIRRVLAAYKAKVGSILEIGCSNGAKLEALCEFFDARGCGVDPSESAVNAGNAVFSQKGKGDKIQLGVSTAASLPYGTASFDLVYFGFCLYLVDRDELYKTIAEADRVLKKGGFLAILDFDPGLRRKREYHHRPGVFSYKTSHADFFTEGGHYYLVAKESFSHGANHFSVDSDERVSLSVLYKEPDAY